MTIAIKLKTLASEQKEALSQIKIDLKDVEGTASQFEEIYRQLEPLLSSVLEFDLTAFNANIGDQSEELETAYTTFKSWFDAFLAFNKLLTEKKYAEATTATLNFISMNLIGKVEGDEWTIKNTINRNLFRFAAFGANLAEANNADQIIGCRANQRYGRSQFEREPSPGFLTDICTWAVFNLWLWQNQALYGWVRVSIYT